MILDRTEPVSLATTSWPYIVLVIIWPITLLLLLYIKYWYDFFVAISRLFGLFHTTNPLKEYVYINKINGYISEICLKRNLSSRVYMHGIKAATQENRVYMEA